MSTHQVTGLVSVHTHAAMTLRPPYRTATTTTADEPLYARVGEAMQHANGYPSLPGHRLYPTSGSATLGKSSEQPTGRDGTAFTSESTSTATARRFHLAREPLRAPGP